MVYRSFCLQLKSMHQHLFGPHLKCILNTWNHFQTFYLLNLSWKGTGIVSWSWLFVLSLLYSSVWCVSQSLLLVFPAFLVICSFTFLPFVCFLLFLIAFNLYCSCAARVQLLLPYSDFCTQALTMPWNCLSVTRSLMRILCVKDCNS